MSPPNPIDQNTDLRSTLIDGLEAPDVSVLKSLRDLKKSLADIDVNQAEMSNEETREDNSRALRDIKKEIEQAENGAADIFNDVEHALLAQPFRNALSVVNLHHVAWEDWSPVAWLKAFDTLDASSFEGAIRQVVERTNLRDLPRWYDTVRESFPQHHTWATWSDALRAYEIVGPGQAPLHTWLIERMVNDETMTVKRVGPDRKPLPNLDAEGMIVFKNDALQSMAWNSLLNDTYQQEALRKAVWQREAPSPDSVDWVRLIKAMRNSTSRSSSQSPIVDPIHLRTITRPLDEVLATGALNAWMAQPEQWLPLTNAPAVDATSQHLIAPWVAELAAEKRFTWNALVHVFEADQQPVLAQRLRVQGESWLLRKTFHDSQPMGLETAVRPRVRL